MTIVTDATSSGQDANATILTIAHTCAGTESNGILVVAIQGFDADTTDRTVDSVTHNGKVLVGAGVAPSLFGLRSDIWYRVNPDTGGSPNIVITMKGKCTDISAEAISLTGIDDGDPIDNTASDTSVGGPEDPALTITTNTANTRIIDSMSTDQPDSGDLSANYNLIETIQDVGSDCGGSQYRDVGVAGNYDISWVDADINDWVLAAVAIKEAAGGPANLLSVNAVTTANIKSINAVLIASVKSINAIA